VSILAGVLLWPRGANRAACASFSDLLGAAGRHLTTGVDRYVHRADDAALAHTASELLAVRERADAAFEELAHETVGDRPPDTDWTAVLAVTSKIGLVGDIMGWASARYGGSPTDSPDLGDLLAEEAGELRTRMEANAAIASGAGADPPAPPPFGPRGPAGRLAAADEMHAAIAAHLGDGPPAVDRVAPILHTGWAHQWLELVADSLTSIDRPVAHIGRLSRRPWWR
jgi:hypothetical protein